MGLSHDIRVNRDGTVAPYEPLAFPVGASQTVYAGGVALVSGSGAVSTGYLKNAATAGSADTVGGMVGEPTGGTYVKTGPGVVGGTTDGAVWVDVLRGAFFFQSGTGSDQLSAATNNTTVYYGGENSSGPIACATGAGTRPVLGTQLPQDPGIAGGFAPGNNQWPIKVTGSL